MSKVIHIITRRETFAVNHKNQFARKGENSVIPTDKWFLTGAVEFRFGKVSKKYTPDDIREKRVPWKYTSGKQRCFITDNDHGGQRTWMSPDILDVMVTEE